MASRRCYGGYTRKVLHAGRRKCIDMNTCVLHTMVMLTSWSNGHRRSSENGRTNSLPVNATPKQTDTHPNFSRLRVITRRSPLALPTDTCARLSRTNSPAAVFNVDFLLSKKLGDSAVSHCDRFSSAYPQPHGHRQTKMLHIPVLSPL